MVEKGDFKGRALEAIRKVRIACDKAENNLKKVDEAQILEKKLLRDLLNPMLQVTGAVEKEIIRLDHELSEAFQKHDERKSKK
jgi:hypothetical protein